MANLVPNQIERLRRTAKQFARSNEISYSAALDHQAQSVGFTTWALMQKALTGPGLIHPIFHRSVDGMKQSFRKLTEAMDTNDVDVLRSQIPDLSREYANPISALRYAQDYLKTALAVPRYSVSTLSLAYYEMRIYLPYAFEPIKGEDDVFIPVGRDYKPLGMTQRSDRVEYGVFKNLHVKIPRNEYETATRHAQYSPRYLYSVGPHNSRRFAEKYLEQLKTVIDLVQRFS